MDTFALVGKSGTGKSYHALDIAHENEIEAIIDDGLLISKGKILAGSSAKHESSKMASVKRAIFENPLHAKELSSCIKSTGIQSVLIVGTSEKMVSLIAERLGISPIKKIFRIEDVASPEEIETAKVMRYKHGKHIIPLPVFEVKKQFSGYFLRSILPQGHRSSQDEKTVMRPTYSYLGNFRISPKVFSDICSFEVQRILGVTCVHKVKSVSDKDGFVSILIEISVLYDSNIQSIAESVQKIVAKAIEDSTSIIVKSVDVFVKDIS